MIAIMAYMGDVMSSTVARLNRLGVRAAGAGVVIVSAKLKGDTFMCF